MLIDLYRKYVETSETIVFDGTFMPYDWGNLPKPLNATWLPYREMFNEYSRELANSLNDLTNYTHRLKVWASVTSSLSKENTMEATQEFIDPVATLALNLPYVIRSRFIFAVSHLCHQANRSLDGAPWKDDLPSDEAIFFATADTYGASWSRYTPLKLRLEKFGDKNYQNATRNFRNAYNHRFSPRIVLGMTQGDFRQVDPVTKAVSYALGGVPALSLESVVALLTEQCERGYASFSAFQDLVREHEARIAAHQDRRASAT